MGKVIILLIDTLDLNEAKLKLLTYKLTMLLALTESSKANEICYLEICYIFTKVTETTKEKLNRKSYKIVKFHILKKCMCLSPH